MSGFLKERWRAIGLLWAVWFYFLIYAQFGLLHLMEASLDGPQLKWVLGSMALSGVAGALFAAYAFREAWGNRMIFVSFLVAGLTAILATVCQTMPAFTLVAALTGLSLGVLTVAVVGYLPWACPFSHIGLTAGLATGLAYWFCNLPPVFDASPRVHCWMAGLAGILALGFLPGIRGTGTWGSWQAIQSRVRGWGSLLPWTVLAFLVLIWSDSAAFADIQQTSGLKSASWGGSAQLLGFGVIHCLAAMAAGEWMDRYAPRLLYLGSFACLFLGYLLIGRHGLGVIGGALYVAGVSAYSTALVSFAALERDPLRIARGTGWVFAIAGWLGSAMGIGMVDDLGRVPILFWLLAFAALGLAIFVPLARKGVKQS
ncbi:hypothetical protein [Coraliomargarita parva]|uniref:hypothetical protein n=1 Tax=Coraliomargarita parva TaxID=3014050 RepID=UPI0022B37807|nr:hypothetical protein [Coraliomargarita parva]